ncbi:MAG: rRNA maturation RNase YbeY [Flavobacterium sp.]|nr:rRNA maturation RNase YbeY [Pedobacter sp.]
MPLKPPINYFFENISFKIKQKKNLRNWICQTIASEGYGLEQVNFIFCNDDYLTNINVNYLKHNTLTDIITFDNSNTTKQVSGDIFISIERVIENSRIFKVKKRDELHRVMIHGVLHLLNYNDKSTKSKKTMTEKENFYLMVRSL